MEYLLLRAGVDNRSIRVEKITTPGWSNRVHPGGAELMIPGKRLEWERIENLWRLIK